MIISYSGKIGSGKDEAGKITQYLTSESKDIMSYDEYQNFQSKYRVDSIFKIMKFADYLKDIVCGLINCTREQLEDPVFKDTELGEEWTRYSYANGYQRLKGATTMLSVSCTKERYELECRINWQTAYRIVYTPRILLQQIGTELFRNQLLNNVWVNALMSKYKPNGTPYNALGDLYDDLKHCPSETKLPNWIITDTRFPNELKAVKDRGGISIRVERWKPLAENVDGKELEVLWGDNNSITKVNYYENGRFYGNNAVVIIEELVHGWREVKENEHLSETALDTATFDYTINNNGTIEELIEKVKEILIKEKII